MNILREIKNFNAVKTLKDMRKFNTNRYNLIEWNYNLILVGLNKDFYLSNNYKNFYLEQFNEIIIDILSFEYYLTEEYNQIKGLIQEVKEHWNEISQEDLKKMADFCTEAVKYDMHTLEKLSELTKVVKNTIIFMQKELVDYYFRLYVREEVDAITLYAKSINELKKLAKNNKIQLDEKLQSVFNRANVCKSKENAFILVTNTELDLLKKFNLKLPEPINFPIWEIDHFKDLIFKNGKGEGIFKEFTPMA